MIGSVCKIGFSLGGVIQISQMINKLFKFEKRDDRFVGQILFFKFKITKSLNNKIYVIKNGKKKLILIIQILKLFRH